MDRLEGKTAFVTGGASGIGKAAALLFSAEGAKVAILDVSEKAGNEVAAEIAAAGGGSIINMSSVVSLIGVPGLDFYTAAKGAVSALTRTLAMQHAASRIRVNAIAPGVTMTERVLALSGGDVSRFPLSRKQVMGPSQPAHVANAALFLASDEAAQVTGVVLPVDGGAASW
jgi:NAD(P)-dependent dehydrogenase (short-subunit alcohol dehydrogenase family)